MNMGSGLSPPEKIAVQDEIKHLKIPFTKEEVKARNNCMFSLCLKVGLPIGIITHLASGFWKKSGEIDRTPKGSFKRGLLIFGNVFTSAFFFKPICEYVVLTKRAELEKKNKEIIDQEKFLPTSEEVQPASQLEDFSYPVDLMTNLNETQDSFTNDYTSTRFETEDVKEVQKVRTTYQDLRARHRSKEAHTSSLPASNSNFDSGNPSTPVRKPASTEELSSYPGPRKVNKYGDEME